MEWTTSHTIILIATHCLIAIHKPRPFSHHFMATYGLALQYELLYGTVPLPLAKILRQTALAIATSSTYGLLTQRSLVQHYQIKHACSARAVWVFHILYHVAPALGLLRFPRQDWMSRIGTGALHFAWCMTDAPRLVYGYMDHSTLNHGLIVAMLTHMFT